MELFSQKSEKQIFKRNLTLFQETRQPRLRNFLENLPWETCRQPSENLSNTLENLLKSFRRNVGSVTAAKKKKDITTLVTEQFAIGHWKFLTRLMKEITALVKAEAPGQGTSTGING